MSGEMIPLAVPSIGQPEIDRVTRAVASGYVSSVGPNVGEFEELFAETVGAKHAVACATGTAAIHLALTVVGVKRESEVAVSDFTFVGSVNPVGYLGARSLLVDSDEETWDLDQDLLVDHLTDRVKRHERLPDAVEVVHILGQPARVDALVGFCEHHGIPLVEDAAESLGGTWSAGPFSGHHTGTIGTVGAFSFNGNKIVTTGAGGMLVTDDGALAARARHLSTQAKVPAVGYLHDEVGFNYRMTNVAAALGLAQLGRLPELLARRRGVAERYDSAFGSLGVTVPPRLRGFDSTYWLYSVLVPTRGGSALRDELAAYLLSHGVECRPLWRPLHLQPPWAGSARLGGAVSATIFGRGLSLPCSFDLTEAQQNHVIELVTTFLTSAAG